MILDAESSTKSPISSGPNSQPQSPVHSVLAYPRSSHVSYATFPAGIPQSRPPGAYPASDITALLGREHPESLSDDDQPPAYDDIHVTRTASSRFWTRCVAVALACLLVYSAWASYEYTKNIELAPDSPSPPLPPSPPADPPSTSATSTPPRVDPTNTPPLPLPIEPSPPPSEPPFVLPDIGRTDLCRPWAYSFNSGAYPAHSDRLPTERLVYNLPTLAPIHLETMAVCPTAYGTHEPCTDYDYSTDAVSGKLQVVAAEVQLPTIELLVQHGSELGLEDVSVCLMQRPLEDDQLAGEEGYKWSLGVYIRKDQASSIRSNLLASFSITIALPATYANDLTTRLDYFNQLIGSTEESISGRLLFGNLKLAGNSGRIGVWNTEARTIDGRSKDSSLSVHDSRISGLLDLKSETGIVTCNVTLVQTDHGPPVRATLGSTAGTVQTNVDLEYPLFSTVPPQFEIKTFSRFSRAAVHLTDHRGTKALLDYQTPLLLPIIRVNLASEAAIAHAVLPATYSGRLSLKSKHANIGVIDQAEDVPGRTSRLYSRNLGLHEGAVHWPGRQASEGSVRISTEYAAARLLFLGFDDSLPDKQPDESSEWEDEIA